MTSCEKLASTEAGAGFRCCLGCIRTRWPPSAEALSRLSGWGTIDRRETSDTFNRCDNICFNLGDRFFWSEIFPCLNHLLVTLRSSHFNAKNRLTTLRWLDKFVITWKWRLVDDRKIIVVTEIQVPDKYRACSFDQPGITFLSEMLKSCKSLYSFETGLKINSF